MNSSTARRAFVIAMECEADAVRDALREGDRLYVAGIGKVNAAAAAMKAICEGAAEVVNAGLAGGLDPAMEIGDVYEVEAAVEYDFDLAGIDGTCIGQKCERSSPYIPLASSGRFPRRKLATGDRFNDNEDDFAVIDALGLTLRDMEGAAIADVCDKAGVPCRMLKCVSDVRGHGAMTGQYLENRTRALEALRRAMLD